jgi:hypothetical protein
MEDAADPFRRAWRFRASGGSRPIGDRWLPLAAPAIGDGSHEWIEGRVPTARLRQALILVAALELAALDPSATALAPEDLEVAMSDPFAGGCHVRTRLQLVRTSWTCWRRCTSKTSKAGPPWFPVGAVGQWSETLEGLALVCLSISSVASPEPDSRKDLRR